MDCVRQLRNFLKTRGEKLISYIGFCADEQQRLKDGNIYPLVDFGINESTILEWAKTEPIFNSYYQYNQRCGCMYCPMSRMANLAYLYVFYPNNTSILWTSAKKTKKEHFKSVARSYLFFNQTPSTRPNTTTTGYGLYMYRKFLSKSKNILHYKTSCKPCRWKG